MCHIHHLSREDLGRYSLSMREEVFSRKGKEQLEQVLKPNWKGLKGSKGTEQGESEIKMYDTNDGKVHLKREKKKRVCQVRGRA